MAGASILSGKKGTEEDHFYFAEGVCKGRIQGKFRGSNHPHRRTDETFLMNIQGFIETNDSALIMLDYQGYGRSTERSQEMYKLGSKAEREQSPGARPESNVYLGVTRPNSARRFQDGNLRSIR
jgi:hypothetical protein